MELYCEKCDETWEFSREKSVTSDYLCPMCGRVASFWVSE
jgi:hypothetical protein